MSKLMPQLLGFLISFGKMLFEKIQFQQIAQIFPEFLTSVMDNRYQPGIGQFGH